MRKLYNILLPILLGVCALNTYGQMADATWTTYITQYRMCDGGCGGELGDEEGTFYIYVEDNVNTTELSAGCQTPTGDNCFTWNPSDIYLGSRTNGSNNLKFRMFGFEDDNGSRCSNDSGDDCDCKNRDNIDLYYRNNVYPSNGTYTASGWNWCSGGDGWAFEYKYTWKYNGTTGRLTPNNVVSPPKTASWTSGAIRSYPMLMSGENTYHFSTCNSGEDTYLRLYGPDGYTIVAQNDDNGPHCSGASASLSYTPSSCAYETYYLEVSHYSRANLQTSQETGLSYWFTVNSPGSAPGNPAVFGNNVWNAYSYIGNDINLGAGTTYAGYYTESSLSYDTDTRWSNNPSPGATPSAASGYQGNCIGSDNHTVRYKRQNFPCAVYKLDLVHDDAARVYVNGTQQYNNASVGSVNNLWTGYLGTGSTVEVRHGEGTGASRQALTLTDVTPTLNGGTIRLNNSTSNQTICEAVDRGSFSNYTTPYGGTIGANGNPAAPVYQWQRSVNGGAYANLSGATGLTYDPNTQSLSPGSYTYRRRVTDACTSNYSNTINVTIHESSPPTATAATTNGSCTRYRANWTSVYGATSYRIDVSTNSSFSSYVYQNINVGTATSYDLNVQLPGTYYYRVRAITACGTSGNSNTITVNATNSSNNDYFRNAIDITSTVASGGTFSTSWTNNGYSEESGEPHSGDQYNSGWYKFTTPAGGMTNVICSISEGSGNNSAIGLYQSNGSVCPWGLTTRDWDRWCFSSGGSISYNCLPGNTTFYVQVATSDNFDLCVGGNNTGSYTVTVNPGSTGGYDSPCAPVHDMGTISGGYNSGNIYYNNSCLSTQSGEPRTGDMSHTMWYKFRTPAGGLESVTVEAAEAGENANYTAVALYQASSCSFSGMTERAFDRWCNADGGDISYDCLPGNTDFYIQLGTGYNFALCTDLLNGGRATGRYRMKLTSSSYSTGINDICDVASNSFTINSTSGSISINNQSNICADTEGGEPGGGQQTVWYKFTTGSTVPYNFNINMDAKTNGLNSDIYVYEACSGCAFGGLNELDNFYDVNPLPGEYDAGGTISGKIKPNSTYYIRADGTDIVGVDGGFDIDISWNGTFNGNDNFCNATNLGTLNNGGTLNSGTFDNYSASAEEQCALNEPNVDNNDETVWFKFTTNVAPGASIDIDASAVGGSGTGGACIAGEISAAWIKVYEETGTISCPFISTVNGFSQIGEPAEVSTGIDVSDVTLTCPDGNTTYWVQVDLGGLSTCDRAQFTLSINDDGYEQGPDDVCDAISLHSALNAGGSFSKNNFSNYCATDEPGEPNTDGNDETVWYKFTTGSNPGVRFDVDVDAEFGSGQGGACVAGEISAGWVEVYESVGGSCAFGNLTAVSRTDFLTPDHKYVDCPQPNTTYFIQVETGGLSTCDEAKFDMNVSMDVQIYPSNDDLCDAFDLLTLNNQATISASALNGGTTFTTFCSSKQTGEPNVDHSEPDMDEEGSVWFKFKPAGTIGGPHQIGAKVAITATEVGEVALTEQLWVRLYTDPANCGTLSDLIEMDNVEDEEYYTPEALLIDDCSLSQIGDAVPRTRFYGCLEPGVTYYVQVIVRESAAGVSTDLGLTDERGHFDLTIVNSRTVPDENDDFVDAQNMPAIPNASLPQNVTYPAPGQLQDVNNLCMSVEAWEFATATPEIPDLDHTAWYRFIAPASGSVQFQVVDAGTSDPEESIEPQLTIFKYDGSGTPSSVDILMEYNADDDFFFGEDGEITWDDYVIVTCLTPGQAYYARIDGAIDATGYCAEIEAVDGDEMRGVYDLYMRDYDIWETNDLICNAGAGSQSDITSSANQTAGDLAIWAGCGTEITIDLQYESNYCGTNLNEAQIDPWDDAIENTVWYSFVAPGTGMVTIDAINVFSCGDPTRAGRTPFIDIRLALYDILDGFDCTSIANGSPVAVQLMGASESDGLLDINCLFLDEELEVDCLEPGRRYWLAVDGKPRTGNSDGTFGEFHLELTNTIEDLLGFNVRDLYQPALNDDICDAIALGDPTQGAGNPNGGVDTDVSNGTYPSPPRSCNNSENTYCADNSGDPAINGFSLWTTDHTVWYTFVAPSTGSVQIYVDGDVHGNSDQLSPQIAVFETSDQVTPCAGNLYDIFVGPAISTGFNTTYNSGTINCLETGNTYFLMVDGGPYAGDLFDLHGTFEVTITEAVATEFGPSHDDICNAKTINPFTSFGGGAPVTLYPDTNRCASREFQIPEPSTFTRDRTVWYEFTTPANAAGSNGNGTYAVDIQVTSDWPWPFGDAMDPQIAVYESSNNLCNGTITEKYSEYDVLNIPFIENLNVQCLLPATTYWIMVDGSLLNPQGYFQLEVTEDLSPTPIAVNDDICSATDLGTIGTGIGSFVGSATTKYNNFCSGIEPGEPDPNWLLINNIDNTVWFKFKTPNNGQNINVDFDLNSHSDDNVDIQIALYQSTDGTCSGTMYQIDSEYDPTLLFCLDGLCDEDLNDICLAPDTEYWLQVDGSVLNRQGYFTVRVINDGFPGGPANDNFCDATLITLNGSGIGRLDGESNECATVEAGEPTSNHPLAVPARRTVWYKFVAPTSGRVEITTEDADGFLGLFGIDPTWALYDFTGSCVGGNFSGTFDQLENSYFPTVGVVNPDDNDDYRCLWPGQTYYIQVDGTFLGIDGIFNIVVEDIYPNYTTTGPEPPNNFCANATTLTVQEKSCQFDDGTWQAFDFGEASRSLPNVVGCGGNCGDTWFKFVMPPLDPNCPGNVSFVKVEGHDYTGIFIDDECLGQTGSVSDLSVIAYRGSCAGLTQIKCSVSSDETIVGDVDYTITGTPGETIWLQVFSNNGNCFDDEDFDLCVSQRYSADECDDALLSPMTLGVEYCWDIRDATGEDIGAGDSGYELGGVPGDNTDNSAYFQFETDDYCWGYQVIIRIDDPLGLSEGGNCNNPGLPIESPSGVMQYTMFLDDTPCDGTYDGRIDFEEIDDCQPGFANEVYWEHTYYVSETPALSGDSVHANDTYIIQLESDNRDIMDGTIEVVKLCDGREWAYTTAIGNTVSDGYCQDPEGWRHYYDDNSTTISTGTHLASSTGDFSGTQGQDGWSYGKYFAFDTYGFTELPNWVGGSNFWADNQSFGTPFLDVNGGHPGVDDLIWSVRRWTSDHTGTINISGDFYDRDGGCGDGAHVRIFKNATEIWNYFNIPTSSTPYSLSVDVVAGDKIDFVIDPKFNSGCDDTHFTAEIEADISEYWEDDILIFSLHPNGNTFDGTATISLANAPYTVQATPATEASWVTRRLWDFDVTSGSINPALPVKIRFYYEENDKQEIEDAAINFALANGLIYEPFEWFKSANGVDFNPSSHINAARVIAEYGSWSGPYTTGEAQVLGTLANQTFPFTEDADAIDGGTGIIPGNAYDVPNIWCNNVQYVEIGGLTGFSGGGGATGAGWYQSPLPVELVTFVGWNEGEVNQLEWVTASEINNELFVVERSTDGIDFVEIGSVPGNGTTSEEHEYGLTDYTPIIGINYYRLKQIDFDGTFEYSAVIAIEVTGSQLHNAIVKLHPNPTRDILNLQLQAAAQTQFELEIWDVKGRKLFSDMYEANAGLNAPISLNVLSYAEGVYIIKVVDRLTGDAMEAKFIKQ